MEDLRKILISLKVVLPKGEEYKFNKKNPLGWVILLVGMAGTFVVVGTWEGLKAAYHLAADTITA